MIDASCCEKEVFRTVNDCPVHGKIAALERTLVEAEKKVCGHLDGIYLKIMTERDELKEKLRQAENRWQAFKKQNLMGLEGVITEAEAPIFNMAVIDREKFERQIAHLTERNKLMEEVVKAAKIASDDLLVTGDARKLAEKMIPNALRGIDGIQKLLQGALTRLKEGA